MRFRQYLGAKIYAIFRLKTRRRFLPYKVQFIARFTQDSACAFHMFFQTICKQSFAYFLTRYCVCNTIKL